MFWSPGFCAERVTPEEARRKEGRPTHDDGVVAFLLEQDRTRSFFAIRHAWADPPEWADKGRPVNRIFHREPAHRIDAGPELGFTAGGVLLEGAGEGRLKELVLAGHYLTRERINSFIERITTSEGHARS